MWATKLAQLGLMAAGLIGLLLALFWLSCRLQARRCPACGSRWRTELQGEWDNTEDWKCHACGHWFSHALDSSADGCGPPSSGGTPPGFC